MNFPPSGFTCSSFFYIIEIDNAILIEYCNVYSTDPNVYSQNVLIDLKLSTSNCPQVIIYACIFHATECSPKNKMNPKMWWYKIWCDVMWCDVMRRDENPHLGMVYMYDATWCTFFFYIYHFQLIPIDMELLGLCRWIALYLFKIFCSTYYFHIHLVSVCCDAMQCNAITLDIYIFTYVRRKHPLQI